MANRISTGDKNTSYTHLAAAPLAPDIAPLRQPLKMLIYSLILGGVVAGPGRPTLILPLGDSLTLGCGSSNASVQNASHPWEVDCNLDAGGYRAPLYHMLMDAGFPNASFAMTGSLSNGPISLPPSQRFHEGHPGWTINKLINIAPTWLAFNADFYLIHAGTNDLIMGHQVNQLLDNTQTLCSLIRTRNPNATILVASLLNRLFNDTYSVLVGFNAALPALVANLSSSQKIYFVDVNERSGWCKPSSKLCTGEHPHTGGYAAMASAWFEVLAPLLLLDFPKIDL